MIYLTFGLSSRNIYLEELIDKSNKIEIKYFNETNLELFYNEIYSGDLFLVPKLIILKNSDKIKDIYKIIEKIKISISNNIDLIIDYESNKENKKIISLFEKENIFLVLTEKENNNFLLKYIEKKLNISKKEAIPLLELLGNDFNYIKNELNKISIYLNNETYSFDLIKNIISKNTNYFIFNITDDILNKKNVEIPKKELMPIFVSLCNDLEIIYKLHILNVKDEGYNKFKDNLSNHEFFKNYSPYYVYKKIKYMKNFNKEKIIKLLDLAFNIEYGIKSGTKILEDSIELFILEIIK